MHGDQRVDCGDLEHPQNSRVGSGDTEAATFTGQRARRGQEHPHPRRVEERALGEVDDDRIRQELRKRFLQPRSGGEVELSRDVHDARAGRRRLAAHVKIVGRGHGSRV